MSEPIPNPLTPYERLRRGPNPRAVVAFMIGFFLFLVVPGVFAAWYAIFAEQTLAGRLLFLALAGVSLFLPVWVGWIAVRRKLKTGKWSPSPEERMQNLAKAAGRKFPSWVNPLMAAAYLCVAVVEVVVALRSPFDLWNCWMALFWIALTGHSLWQLYRDTRKPSAA